MKWCRVARTILKKLGRQAKLQCDHHLSPMRPREACHATLPFSVRACAVEKPTRRRPRVLWAADKKNIEGVSLFKETPAVVAVESIVWTGDAWTAVKETELASPEGGKAGGKSDVVHRKPQTEPGSPIKYKPTTQLSSAEWDAECQDLNDTWFMSHAPHLHGEKVTSLKTFLDDAPAEIVERIFSIAPELLDILEIGYDGSLPGKELRMEMVRRVLLRHKKEPRYKRRVEQILDAPGFKILDPTARDNGFVGLGRRLHASRKRLEHADVLSDGYNSLCDRELKVQRTLLQRMFFIFARSIGVRVKESIEFVKSDHDQALEIMLGSAEREGEGVYCTPGMLEPLLLSRDLDSARAFSLYMARKAFVCHDPRDLAKKTEGFLEDVLAPPPLLPDSMQSRREQMIRLVRKVARLFFHPGKTDKRAVFNNGKACLELPRSKGGKRSVLYGRDLTEIHRFNVLALTIISSGKARPITVASVFQCKHSWLNSFMFNRLRKCDWMIAGGEMEDFVARCIIQRLPVGHVFLSGDLESATTLFFGGFCEGALEEIRDHKLITTEDLTEILGSVTRSHFVSRDLGATGGVCEHGIDLMPTYKCRGVQQRGQNLGADVSFPILCLVSMAIGFETDGLTDMILEMEDPKAHKFVTGYRGFGVNGDDFVGFGGLEKVARWKEAVACTGGRPCPPKSPVNRDYFTANSQLWMWSEPLDKYVMTDFVSPSLLLNLTECTKIPQTRWLTQLSSPLIKKDLGLSRVIFPDVPRVHGGLGGDPEPNLLWAKRYLYSRLAKGVNVTKELEEPPPGIQKNGNKYVVTPNDSSAEPIPVEPVVVTGLIRREWLDRYAVEVYRLRNILEWSSSKPRNKKHAKVIKAVKTEINHPEFDLIRLFNTCSTENAIFDMGYVYVQNKTFFTDVEVFETFPKGFGSWTGLNVREEMTGKNGDGARAVARAGWTPLSEDAHWRAPRFKHHDYNWDLRTMDPAQVRDLFEETPENELNQLAWLPGV